VIDQQPAVRGLWHAPSVSAHSKTTKTGNLICNDEYEKSIR